LPPAIRRFPDRDELAFSTRTLPEKLRCDHAGSLIVGAPAALLVRGRRRHERLRVSPDCDLR
jgi:hypothetical protein